jgi:hypothetical protein
LQRSATAAGDGAVALGKTITETGSKVQLLGSVDP